MSILLTEFFRFFNFFFYNTHFLNEISESVQMSLDLRVLLIYFSLQISIIQQL